MLMLMLMLIGQTANIGGFGLADPLVLPSLGPRHPHSDDAGQLLID